MTTSFPGYGLTSSGRPEDVPFFTGNNLELRSIRFIDWLKEEILTTHTPAQNLVNAAMLRDPEVAEILGTPRRLKKRIKGWRNEQGPIVHTLLDLAAHLGTDNNQLRNLTEVMALAFIR